MAKRDVEPGISAQLERLLMAAKPKDLSVRKWCQDSKLSTSFFTDLRDGKEPGIDKIERLARRVGLNLWQLIKGGERPIRLPDQHELTAMVEIAQREVKVGQTIGDYPTAVASSLGEQLQRFVYGVANDHAAKEETEINHAAAVQSRKPTKQAAQG